MAIEKEANSFGLEINIYWKDMLFSKNDARFARTPNTTDVFLA